MSSLLRFRVCVPSSALRAAGAAAAPLPTTTSTPHQHHQHQQPTATTTLCTTHRQLHQTTFAHASKASRPSSASSARPPRQPVARHPSNAEQQQQQPASPTISSPAFDPSEMIQQQATAQAQKFLPPRHVFSYDVARDYDGDLLRAGNDWVQSSRNTGIDWQMKHHVRSVSKLARQEVPTTIRQRQVRQGKRRAKDNELLTMMRATLYKKILGRLI